MFSLTTDANGARLSYSVECAGMNSDSVGIYVFSLSVMPAMARASDIKKVKWTFGSSVIFKSGSLRGRVYARESGNIVKTEASLSNYVRPWPFVLRQDSAQRLGGLCLRGGRYLTRILTVLFAVAPTFQELWPWLESVFVLRSLYILWSGILSNKCTEALPPIWLQRYYQCIAANSCSLLFKVRDQQPTGRLFPSSCFWKSIHLVLMSQTSV